MQLESGSLLRQSNFWAALGALATAVGVVVAVIALWKANDLQKENNKLQSAQLDARLEEGMIGLDRYFASHPDLRPYFFADAHAGVHDTLVTYETRAAAEMIIDFADDVAAYSRMSQMSVPAERRWERIIRPYFAQSRVTRQIWHQAHGAYDKVTACFLGAPSGREIARWHWRTDRPSAPRHKVCA